MKIVILFISLVLFTSCAVLTWDKPKESSENEHPHGVETHIHKDDEWWEEKSIWLEFFEPVIPVSDFWISVGGASQVDNYIESMSWSMIKIHGSLYLSSGDLLWDTKILYWYYSEGVFEEVWNIDSDAGWQYYFKSIATQRAQDYFYIEIMIWEVLSRIYFVPNSFDANVFVKQYENLPDNMYFAKIVMLDDDIISGVDILVDPS